MTIRSRLLFLLLPTLIAFVVLMTLFFYFSWSYEILESFKSHLQSPHSHDSEWIQTSVEEMDRQLRHALLIISLGACLIILTLIVAIYLITEQISKPVRQLNQAALDIAAGNYEANIHVQGPKEIVELANTLNVMSECLAEHINRLHKSSLVRERMYGEYECAQLLQYYMFQKVSEEFNNPHFTMHALSVNLSTTQQGLLLKQKSNQSELKITLIEAKDQGFASLYELSTLSSVPLDKLEDHGFIQCTFTQNYSQLSYQVRNLPSPLVWCLQSQQFNQKGDQEISLHPNDMIFLYNQPLVEQFGNQENFELWFSRILRHFAEDGLKTIYTMLTNELNFLNKKDPIKKNFHLLGLHKL